MMWTTCDRCGEHRPVDWAPDTLGGRRPTWAGYRVLCAVCLRDADGRPRRRRLVDVLLGR